MRLNSAIVFSVLSICSLVSQAAPMNLKVHHSKQITANVDRFYGKEGTAFATIFCSDKAAEVMIVDGRLKGYDGVTFLFASPEDCQKARDKARQDASKCNVTLSVDLSTYRANVQSSCR